MRTRATAHGTSGAMATPPLAEQSQHGGVVTRVLPFGPRIDVSACRPIPQRLKSYTATSWLVVCVWNRRWGRTRSTRVEIGSGCTIRSEPRASRGAQAHWTTTGSQQGTVSENRARAMKTICGKARCAVRGVIWRAVFIEFRSVLGWGGSVATSPLFSRCFETPLSPGRGYGIGGRTDCSVGRIGSSDSFQKRPTRSKSGQLWKQLADSRKKRPTLATRPVCGIPSGMTRPHF